MPSVLRLPQRTWHNCDLVEDVDPSVVVPVADLGWWHVHCSRDGQASAFVINDSPLYEALQRVRERVYKDLSAEERVIAMLSSRQKWRGIHIGLGDIDLAAQRTGLDGIEAWQVDLSPLPIVGDDLPTGGSLLFPMRLFDLEATH